MSSNTKGCRETTVLQGIGVSPGVVVGPAHLMVPQELRIVERELDESELDHEIARLEQALIETRRQIRRIQADIETGAGLSDASILEAHLMVLDDRSFIEEIVRNTREQRRNIEVVVRDAADRYAAILSSVEDDYLRERVADVRDVARRIIRNLIGNPDEDVSEPEHRRVVVAHDLAPSETASMRKDKVLGFATDLGSPTSHTALMARALEIPAIVGMRNITAVVQPGDEILIDGNKGVLIVNPTAVQLEEYGRVAENRRHIELDLNALRDQPAETRDGHRITLSANVESVDELDSVLQHGAHGVGLFRSEYLYLADARVSEDEQAAVYAEVARRVAPAPAIIRTLDIGGDKILPDSQHAREANPFMGCRSIRFCLLHVDVFKVQLRALLRASVNTNLKIMYPMICSVSEVIEANRLLDECKAELAQRHVPFNLDIEVGVMIEIPAAALSAGVIAEHVKFFSIGTNDLIQYTLAVDRVNEHVAYLYEPTHPAVLRLINETVTVGHAHGLWVGLCGEMAADPLMTPLLVGLGIDELSVAPAAVPMVKDAVRGPTLVVAQELARKALACKSAPEVIRLCRELMKEVAPELLELI